MLLVGLAKTPVTLAHLSSVGRKLDVSPSASSVGRKLAEVGHFTGT